MQQVLDKLKDNLERQILLYNKMGDLAVCKQKALIANQIAEIDSITKQEEKLIFDAGELERERMAWAEEIGKAMNRPAEELTLNELAVRFPELKAVRLPLEQAIARLKDTHELNTQLLEQAVEVVNLTMDLLTQPAETTYTQPGKEAAPPKKLHVVDRSV